MHYLLHFLTPRRLVLLGKSVLAMGKGLTFLGKILSFGGNLGKILLLVICIVVGVIAVVTLLPWWQDFRRELRCIETEIGRTEGREQARWKKRKRRLWLSLIPFIHY